MATKITMPRLSDTMTEGTVATWLKKVGDVVKDGQTLFILEAMKMENNITSEFNGKVINIFVKPGEIVPEGAPLVEIAHE